MKLSIEPNIQYLAQGREMTDKLAILSHGTQNNIDMRLLETQNE